MSRIQRTKQFRDTVEKEWKQKFNSFINEYSDKDWNWYIMSKNYD